MNRFIIATTTLLLLTFSLFGQSCLPDGITFRSQQEIDDFILSHPNCTQIKGTVIIESSNSINNLQGLKNIRRVEGAFRIRNTDNLTNLKGLEQLTYVGKDLAISRNDNLIDLTGLEGILMIDSTLSIIHNPNLESLLGLDNIQRIEGNVDIFGNRSLKKLNDFSHLHTVKKALHYAINGVQHLEGFIRLRSIGDIDISVDDSLETISAFPNLITVDALNLSGIPNLKNITSFNQIEELASLVITDCDALIDIHFLSAVEAIFGPVILASNDALENLGGLDNLKFAVSNLRIVKNESLNSISALSNLNFVARRVLIEGNPKLENLDGLENISFDENFSFGIILEIINNATLTDISALKEWSFSNFNNLKITGNALLSNCSISSICTYIDTNGSKEIRDNLCGCNSIEEVLANCTRIDNFSSTISTIYETICEGDTYPFDTFNLDSSGSYIQTLMGTSVCDSVIRLNLTVLEKITTNLVETIPFGTSYFFNNQQLTTSGDYRDTLTNINGCDSILLLNLMISPLVEYCNNGIDDDGDNLIDNLDPDCPCFQGLDTSNLVINGDFSNYELDCCASDLPDVDEICVDNWTDLYATPDFMRRECFWRNDEDLEALWGFGFPIEGTFMGLLQKSLPQIINPATSTSEIIGQCLAKPMQAGQTYYISFDLAAQERTLALGLEDLFFTVNGIADCGQLNNFRPERNVCELGLPFTEISTVNVMKLKTGWNQFTFEFTPQESISAIFLAGDCTVETERPVSIFTFIDNLKIQAKQEPVATNPTELAIEICENEGYQFGSQTITESGIYQESFQNQLGCDSLVELTLSVLPTQQGDTLFVTQEAGSFFNFHGTEYDQNGVYEAVLNNSNGCDSVVFLNLEIEEPQAIAVAFQTEVGIPTCATINDGFLAFMIQEGIPPFQFSIDGGVTYADNPFFENLPVGEYQLQVKDGLNSVTIPENIVLETSQTLSISLGVNQQLTIGQTTKLGIKDQNFTPIQYEWSSNQTMNCYDCPTPTIYPETTDYYYLTATNENGCTASDSLLIEVLPRNQLFIPTVFSPNGDGLNDQFSILGLPEEMDKVQALEIFDRWGNLVYQSTIATNANSLSWDGQFNDRITPTGVYIYQLQMINEDGRIDVLTGDIMLVK